MRRLLTGVVLSLCLSSAFAARAEPSLAGHYYLSGVTEVGSELLLRPDATFEWTLSYGAVDLAAAGHWSREGDKIELVNEGAEREPRFSVMGADDLDIVRAAEPGTWVAVVGVPRMGPFVGVEVTFEGSAGTRVTAVTDRNGDAQIQAIQGQTWTRAGLRHDKSAPVQWLAVPKARSEQRIAGFKIDDPLAIMPKPFDKKMLSIRGQDLVDEEQGPNFVYSRR